MTGIGKFTVVELWPDEHFVIDPSGIPIAVGRSESQAQGISTIMNEYQEMRRELASIDEAFSRRPALADCSTRYEKACKACAIRASELLSVKT